ncbi:hypothetical protein D6D79_08660 [Moraxella catarrhalis]|nr:hypothetical protein E9Y_05767 [Moraxella catarrhalis 101P30B1]MPW55290.1 hypothetical protein [Moraxella catarrhalis]MPX01366.1 hypothetical protein [Moraxella catarrhalis]MPX16165.1 hypothetical protein [Moraxella catarrhalis]MPX41826.1 hypothetical protein [Moraxella catarrhalis]
MQILGLKYFHKQKALSKSELSADWELLHKPVCNPVHMVIIGYIISQIKQRIVNLRFYIKN